MANETVAIEDALHAYNVIEQVKEEMTRMEEHARQLYADANERHNAGDIRGSSDNRSIGNAIMEHLTNLKLIIFANEMEKGN